MSHLLIPITNKKRINIEAKIYKYSRKIDNSNLHREIAKDTYIFVKNYNSFVCVYLQKKRYLLRILD